ncbi:MAG: acetate CoA-transferase [Peptococcaceae bacterium BICA1-8]|nr:MAG: acetate CoA-transferase [Peptococcaceae bacterium BICA1-8]
MDKKEFIARRVAQEFKDGDFVNLGIGIPTLVGNYIPEGIKVYLHSENGFTHIGPMLENENEIDPELINASDQHVSILPGGAFFDSGVSFGIIRGGHLAATVLGALQVDQEGNLANWKIPGKKTVGIGGGMDLVSGAKRVIIAMEHTSKGASKILKKCDIPLTGLNCVDLIVTEMAVIEVTESGLLLKEIAEDVTLEDVLATTEADLIISPDLKKISV